MHTPYKNKRGPLALCATLLAILLLAGCAAAENATGESTSTFTATQTVEDDFSWNESDATIITLNGTSADISGSGASASGGGATITDAGTYVLRGSLSDGQVLVEADKSATVKLVLDGADITSTTSAPIYSASAGKTILVLANGSYNTLKDGQTYQYAADEDEPDAALFAKGDLSIGGSGTLEITASYNNGIGCKDNLVMAGGTLLVTAANHAIRGRDSVTVYDGSYTLTAGNDGLQSNNDGGEDVGWIDIQGGSFTINAAHDGIQAETNLTISGGTFNITTAEGANSQNLAEEESYKGLKTTGDIIVSGGTFALDTADDAVHANGSITIDDGAFTIATGDDGMHADGVLTINGGTVDITQSYEGLEGSTINIHGGEISLVASDDGINAAGGERAVGDYLLNITGGTIEVNAQGDGVDSNGSITMSGGTLLVHGPTSGGDGALDYETTFELTSGTIAAAGSSPMAMTPSATSTQPSLIVFFTSTREAGDTIELKDQNSNTLVSFTPQKQFQSIVLTADGLKQGETYALYTSGSLSTEVTLTDVVTSIDETGAAAQGGFGGFGGGMPGDGMGGGRGGDGQDGGFGGVAPPNEGTQPPDMDGDMPEMPSGGFDGTPPNRN